MSFPSGTARDADGEIHRLVSGQMGYPGQRHGIPELYGALYWLSFASAPVVSTDGGRAGVGGAGLIVNGLISRGDLWPWLCALYVEEPFRGQGLGGRLISHICGQALALGYHSIHLCTGHVGYYERYGFVHGGTGYHPWGESSRIYSRRL